MFGFLRKNKKGAAPEGTVWNPDLTLPPGWASFKSEHDGRIVYRNSTTHEITTERPNPSSIAPSQSYSSTGHTGGNPQRPVHQNYHHDQTVEVPSRSQHSTVSQLTQPQEWMPMRDPASGNTYYRHASTGEMRWDKPPVASDPRQNQSPNQFQLTASNSQQWLPLRDENSGKVYYRNNSTGQVSWEKPVVAVPVTAAQSAPAPAPAPAPVSPVRAPQNLRESQSQLPPGWSLYTDPATGKPYYSELATGRTTWERPKPNVDVTVSAQAPAPVTPVRSPQNLQETQPQVPSGWSVYTDATTGKPYYVELATGRTTWDAPKASDDVIVMVEPAVAPAPAPVPAPVSPVQTPQSLKETQPQLPPGWSMYMDPATGNPYYTELATGRTSWEAPKTSQPQLAQNPTETSDSLQLPSPEELVQTNSSAEEIPLKDLVNTNVVTPTSSHAVIQQRPLSSDQAEAPSQVSPAKQDEIVPEPQNSPIPSQVSAADSTLAGWDAQKDPKSGRTYYRNFASGETTWENPGDVSQLSYPTTQASELQSQLSYSTTQASELQAPQGWEVLQDPGNGKTYYRNLTTGETSWEKPNEVQAQTPVEESSDRSALSPGTVEAEVLPESWESIQDPSSGKTYYVNRSTGEATWEKPGSAIKTPDQIPVPPSSNEAPAPIQTSSWVSFQDPSSGKTYYVNKASGETTWENPESTIKASDPQTVSPLSQDTPGAMFSTSSWESFQDPSSGRTYYKNVSTGETTWEKPEIPNDVSNQVPISPPSNESPLSLLSSWETLQVPSSGRVYYRNKSTGETTFDKPAGLVDAFVPPPESPQRRPLVSASSWETLHDLSSGRSYYRNKSTGEVALERPEASRRSLTSQGNSRGDLASPSSWQSFTDPSTGRPYYRNMSTGETSWENPDAPPSPSNSAAPKMKKAPLPPGWAAIVDDKSGKTFYANSSTGEATWTKPAYGIQESSPGEGFEDDRNKANDDSDEYYHDGTKWVRRDGREPKDVVVEDVPDVTTGHSYLMLCCDMRKSVIITNAIAMIIYILFLNIIFLGVDFLGSVFDDAINTIFQQITDADVKAWLDTASGRVYEICYAGVGILFCLIGIIGGIRFNMIRAGKFNFFFALVPVLLYTANIAGLLYFLLEMYKEEYIVAGVGCAVNCLCLYPHLAFMVEVKRGIMISKNYKRAAHWCCCAKKNRAGSGMSSRKEKKGWTKSRKEKKKAKNSDESFDDDDIVM